MDGWVDGAVRKERRLDETVDLSMFSLLQSAPHRPVAEAPSFSRR